MPLPRLHVAPKFAIIAAFAVAIMLGLAFGSDTFQPQPAHAAGQLDITGSCDPERVRPNETALIHCTVTLTNNGDEPLTDLRGRVFFAAGCDVPGRFVFLERRDGDELIRAEPQGLGFDVQDLAPGETGSNVTRIAVENFSTGPAGGSVTISSASKPGTTARVDLCWDVQDDASAPPTNLTVTKTSLSNIGDVIVLDEPEAPPQPVGGEPVPILPPAPPVGNEVAKFELVIINIGDVTMSDVTLMDAPIGAAIFVDAEPGITSFDPLGRPFWDIGELAPGEEFRVVATYGPSDDGNCSVADGVAIVEGKPEGGEREDYAAFSDFAVPVGPCEFEHPDLCEFYPPDGDFPVTDLCDSEVCWATTPDGFSKPVFDCSGDISYCWFTAPGEGGPSLSPCDTSVCWVSFGGDGEFEYWGEVPCDAEFCQYTSPDGRSTTKKCSFPICWAENPIGGFWQEIFHCEESFEAEACWFVAPDGSRASLIPCEEEICWISFGPGDFLDEVPCEFEFCQYTAPDGSTTATSDCEYPPCWASPPGTDTWQQVYDCGEFQEWCWFAPPGLPEMAILNPCDSSLSFAVNLPEGGMVYDPWQLTIFHEGEFDWCWPIPPEAGDFYTFPVFCEEIESIYWFQQDDGTYVPSFGPNRGCFGPILVDGLPIPIPPRPVIEDTDAGRDLLPGPCTEGNDAEPGVQGSSIPVEVAPAISTSVELAEGTVEPIEPQPSLSVTPVELVRGDVEVIEPSPSADVIPAELVPSDRTEPFPFPEFPDDIVLPVDEEDRPTARPGPGHDDDAVDTTTRPDDEVELTAEADDELEANDLEITKLPEAGSGTASADRPTITLAVGLALASLLALGAFGLRLARPSSRRRGL